MAGAGAGALAGRRALVTGGCGTIGRALAAAFAREGAAVTVLDRPGATPPEGMGWLPADLADPAGAEAAVRAAAEADGPFDILLSNAALILNRPFEAFSPADWEEQMRVNAGAAFALARALSPGMKARGWGRIVAMTSVTLSGEWEGYVPYAASKGALWGLVKGLARELGPHGITVNALSPGAVVSEAEARLFGDRQAAYADWVLGRQCLKRRLVPEDIAGAALFLCSEGASMVTGQTLRVDGGW
jgi:NAD(P)-dependent dehydrogenase (short-subunit alcohol dehydrogenase family)